MAKQVKIIRVSGNYAQTADGRSLRIIGNVRPGNYGWTDGKVLYGYGVPGFYMPPIPPRPVAFPFLLTYDIASNPYDVWTEDNLQYTFRPECPPLLWWKDKRYVYDGTNVVFNGQPLYNLTNAWVAYFRNNHFWFQTGDYCPTLATTMWYWYGGKQWSMENPVMPVGMALSRSGNLRTLSYVKDAIAVNSNVAGVVTDVLDDLLDEMPASTGPTGKAWFAFVMVDNNSFDYKQYHVKPNANLDYNARRFLRISDTEVVFWIDVVGITYQPNNGEVWWPQGVRFRVCIRTDFTGYTVLYKRRTRAWLNEIGWDAYAVQIEDTVVTPETAYNVDLGEGYYWNSGDKLVYKQNAQQQNTPQPVDITPYDEIKGVYKGHILGRPVNDSSWYFDGNMVLYRPFGWSEIDQFCVMPVYK